VNGILLLDKPAGIGSNDALQKAKSLFQARKAGHTGSLDRGASGLLPLCFGEATKFSSFLLGADKIYAATFRLGIVTTTGDSAGEVLERLPVPDLDEERLRRVLGRFTGEIQQVPPMYSALKHKGQRLYDLAYRGIEVEREPRPVTIHELELRSLSGDRFDVSITCSKGTYVRTLAEDIGRELGCGAHVESLRRTGVGPFRLSEAVALAELEEMAGSGEVQSLDRLLLDVDEVLRDIPAVQLVESAAFYLCQGQPVMVPHAPTTGRLRLYNEAREFLGIGEVLDDGRVAPRRLVSGG
jgi:tRNA pseudouridine55 synthase